MKGGKGERYSRIKDENKGLALKEDQVRRIWRLSLGIHII